MNIKFLALAAGTEGPMAVSLEAMQRIADDLRIKGKMKVDVNGHKVEASVLEVEINERGLEVTINMPEDPALECPLCSCGEDVCEGPSLPHKTTCPKQGV